MRLYLYSTLHTRIAAQSALHKIYKNNIISNKSNKPLLDTGRSVCGNPEQSQTFCRAVQNLCCSSLSIQIRNTQSQTFCRAIQNLCCPSLLIQVQNTQSQTFCRTVQNLSLCCSSLLITSHSLCGISSHSLCGDL